MPTLLDELSGKSMRKPLYAICAWAPRCWDSPLALVGHAQRIDAIGLQHVEPAIHGLPRRTDLQRHLRRRFAAQQRSRRAHPVGHWWDTRVQRTARTGRNSKQASH